MNNNSKICIGLSLTLTISLTGVNQNAFADNYTPTLDELNKQGVINPATGEKYPESGYTLVETDVKGDNTIVIPEYNKDNNTLTEKLYNLELKKYDYGHTDVADDTYSFNIDIFDRDITYSTDNSRLESNRIINSTDLALIDKDFYGLSGHLDGGAINNSGRIDSITGDFIGNYATSSGNTTYGGAISNRGTIGSITGDFIGNYASDYGDGGAIDNGGEINIITGDFIGNYASSNSSASGGAIYNGGEINIITGDFIGNYVTTFGNFAHGGAIYNYGTIGSITGDFIGNYANGNDQTFGGAIYNDSDSTIETITGDFIGNYASGSSLAYGGAIYNYTGTIDSITGDFIGNYASGDDRASGGAIYNSSYSGSKAIINNITGDFIGNYASGGDEANGGAIYNSGTIGSISGDFIGNYARGDDEANGGAIYNDSTIDFITGNFIGNYASGGDAASGGAIYNWFNSTIDSITGDFIGNYASGGDEAYGGAIYNENKVKSITGDFIGNYATSASGGAYGGAIYNEDTIGSITGDFTGNYAIGEPGGGAISNETDGSIESITGNFVGNYTNGDLNAYGGAIENYGTIGQIDGSFVNNYAKADSANSFALGGAILTTSDLTFVADNKQNVFSGNYTEDSRGKINNAIFVENGIIFPDGPLDYGDITLTFDIKNNGSFVFDDTIDGGMPDFDDMGNITGIDRTNQYNIKIQGDNTGYIAFNNDVINADIVSDNANIILGKDSAFNQSQSLALNNSSLSMVNNSIGSIIIPEFNLSGISSMKVDVDLLNEKMDRIEAGSYNVSPDSKLNVDYLNLLNDANKDLTLINFADSDLANNVDYTGENPVAYSPIYKYDVGYDKTSGIFSFLRGSGSSSSDYNPTVLAPATMSLAGAYSTQMQTFNYAFQHSDNFMNLPYIDRVVLGNKNKYAFNGEIPVSNAGVFSPIFSQFDDASIWVKPYTSFESIPLKNGPKVSNISYGTLVGFDSKLKKLKRGFSRVYTGYLGYNGASQRYSGVDSTLNGGLLGGTVTFYKGNFFNATTLSVGASVAKNSNMYGTDNLTMLMGGVGNKTGYNFEFKEGKLILQPNILLSYTFVNTFDYTNSAGVRMTSDPLHAIQIAPGVKLIGNLKNGWQPYLGVNMVWNIIADSKVMANDVILPEMSIRPYVQYGVGVQKTFKDRFQGFLQAMVQNGGRNGISLTAGFRWAI